MIDSYQMPNIDPSTRDLLRLTLTPGLGPVLIGRAVTAFGSARAVLEAPGAQLKELRGIGRDKAQEIRDGIQASEALADAEIALADSLGVALIGLGQPQYPALLAQIPDPPPVLYTKGALDAPGADRYPIAVVGSRSCSHYGREQAERFGLHLAQAGLCVVSGGARGIDTGAHRRALRAQGRTVAVLGCGLAMSYPPENEPLFAQICAGAGAVISELPLRTAPVAENFPARNRIISGLCLGVLVVEAGRRSGALITARLAAEDHGREVFALPARVDSPSAEGSLDLIKRGGALLVTHPADIIDTLESPARHHFDGTHAAVTTDPSRQPESLFAADRGPAATPDQVAEGDRAVRDGSLTPSQRAILAALDEPRTMDELAREVGSEPASVRAEVTVLEIKRRIQRHGTRLSRVT